MIRLFSAQFPLNESGSLENLLEVSKKWISCSPWSKLEDKDFAKININGDFLKKEEYSFELIRAENENEKFLGFRYVNPANGGEDKYYTTVIGFKSPNKFLTSVTVDYDSAGARINIPTAKKPYILKLFLEDIGGGRDGDILVKNRPVYIKDGEEDFVRDILKGIPGSIMPVVYVSRDITNRLIIEPSKLSIELAGVANVLVEPSRDFSFKLKNLMKGYNVYGGAIGAYWPDDTGKYVWYVDDLKESGSAKEISLSVIDALSKKRLLRQLTWDNIQSLNNLATIKTMKEGHDTSLNQLLEIYDSELKNKDRRISDAETNISRLDAELRKAKANMSFGEGLVNDPSINQLYKGEIKFIIISGIQQMLHSVPNMTRKKQILESILQSNEVQDSREEFEDKIKKMFNDYTGLTGKMREELKRMGFSINEDGKHYKLYIFGEEGGLSVAIPKTPSDFRSGKNTASQIMKTFF